MSWLSFFRPKKRNTASVAKDRLKIIVTHDRARNSGADYLPMLQKELMAVIAKYIKVDEDQVRVHLERSSESATLELNVSVPDLARQAQG